MRQVQGGRRRVQRGTKSRLGPNADCDEARQWRWESDSSGEDDAVAGCSLRSPEAPCPRRQRGPRQVRSYHARNWNRAAEARRAGNAWLEIRRCPKTPRGSAAEWRATSALHSRPTLRPCCVYNLVLMPKTAVHDGRTICLLFSQGASVPSLFFVLYIVDSQTEEMETPQPFPHHHQHSAKT